MNATKRVMVGGIMLFGLVFVGSGTSWAQTVQLAPALNYSLGLGITPRCLAVGECNGDGQQALAVVNQGSNTVSVLINNTTRVPADFDGDGKTDIAVYQASSGNWFYVGSTSGFGSHIAFGGPDFTPVPGDYDGDGFTDTAVYDTTNGNWFISQSTAGFTVHPSFGGPGYVPVLPQVTILRAMGLL